MTLKSLPNETQEDYQVRNAKNAYELKRKLQPRKLWSTGSKENHADPELRSTYVRKIHGPLKNAKGKPNFV